MQLLCDRALVRAVQSLNSDQNLRFGSFVHGETIPISASVVDPILETSSTRIWTPLDVSTGTIKAAVGKGFALPIAGSFRLISGVDQTAGPLVTGKTYLILTYEAGDDFTNVGAAANTDGEFFTATGTTPTTWTNGSVLQDVTAELAYNCTYSDIQTALNALPSIFAAGSVVVSGSNGFFTITWNDAGSRPQIWGDAAALAPLSLIDAGTLVEGDTDPVLREVQTIQIMQDAGAFVSLTVNNAAASVGVDPVQVGGGGQNAQYRITLGPTGIYDGKFTLTVGGDETTFIAWNDDGDGMLTALEDLASVGTGNVVVSREATSQWLIMFIGSHANEDMGTITGNASGLSVISSKSGTLDLRTAGIALILGQNNTAAAIFEVQYTPMGGTPQTVCREDITLVMPVIKPASVTPTPRVQFYDKEEIDALLLSLRRQSGYSFSSAGNTDLSKAAATEIQSTYTLAVGAGSGSYTRTLTLTTTNCANGDTAFVTLSMPASANPTIEVRDATSGGTLLCSFPGSGDATVLTLQFTFNGTAWIPNQSVNQ